MTEANSARVGELVAEGLERREARWLVDEFGADHAELQRRARRRLGGEPLQYVLGHWPFRGLDLLVTPHVLIPRPETEGLVDVALAELERGGVAAPLVLDLGTGSGAIGLSLLDESRRRGVAMRLVASDASDAALAVARANADRHDLAATFVRSSWFDDIDDSLRGGVALIVANPPYVDEGIFNQLDPVLHFEPYGALVAPAKDGVGGFADVAAVIAGAYSWLAPHGSLVLEHADTQRDAVASLARATGYASFDDLDDLAGFPRVLVARR